LGDRYVDRRHVRERMALLLASDREHAAMLLTVHRSLGVVTWAVAIVRRRL
jgi:hypothetical protein